MARRSTIRSAICERRRPPSPARSGIDDLETLLRWDDDREDWAAEPPRRPVWREGLIAEIKETAGPASSQSSIRLKTKPYVEAISGLANGSSISGSAPLRIGSIACLIDPLASDVAAQQLYARHGFRIVAPRRFGEDDRLFMHAIWTKTTDGSRQTPFSREGG